MPIFEYVCKECQHAFEALVFGKQKAECPKCHSKKLEGLSVKDHISYTRGVPKVTSPEAIRSSVDSRWSFAGLAGD